MDNPEQGKRRPTQAEIKAFVDTQVAAATEHSNALLNSLDLSPAEKRFAQCAGTKTCQLLLNLFCSANDIDPHLRFVARTAAAAYALDYFQSLASNEGLTALEL